MNFELIWYDSLGAKSTCTLVTTEDISILIDPGAAIMQPGFPADLKKKYYWLAEAEKAIISASKKANIVIISHYHYDHFTDFEKILYENKTIFAKNPNEYINDSQRERAENFYNNLSNTFSNAPLQKYLQSQEPKEFTEPLDELPLAQKKDLGDYNKRREELLQKGKKWFRARVKKWNSYQKIPELTFEKCKVKFADGKCFRFGNTEIYFTRPLFHGIEYARVGWIIATVIRWKDRKLLHTSDVEGPIIEDYTEWIIKEKPNILILDGPSTYLIPYMQNLINLRRAVENLCRIIEKSKKLELIIYDHHLLREPKYKERVKEVYETAESYQKKVITAAEFLGNTPVVLNG